MRRLRAWLLRFAGLFHKGRRDDDLVAEIESNLQLHADENLRRGMTPEEARRQAHIQFGGVETMKEDYRERRGIPFIEQLVQDVRYGLRLLRKNLSLTIAVVLTLGLCIGANTAVFGVVHAVVLSPLRFVAPDQLVVLRETGTRGRGVSMPDAENWREQSDIFDGMGVYKIGQLILTGTDDFQPVFVGSATPSLFTVLGVKPALGRVLVEGDSLSSTGSVAVVSESFWRTHFASNPGIVGKNVRLGNDTLTIVGVVPFDAPFQNVAFWLPLHDTPALEQRNNRSLLAAVARLKQSVTITQARSQMRVIDGHLARTYKDSNAGWTTSVDRLRDVAFGDSPLPVYLLFGATCFLMLLGCANVSNLLIGRATERRKEMAARVAMGASPGRILRQLMVEGLILAATGGVAGFLCAYWGLKVLIASLPNNIPRLMESRLDGAVLAFAVGVTLVAAILSGVLPAVLARSISPSEILKGTEAGPPHSRARYLRDFVVVIECFAATLLLVGASLAADSMLHLYRAGEGLEPAHAIVMQFRTGRPASSLAGQNASQAQISGIVGFTHRISGAPFVQAVGAISDFPLQPVTNQHLFTADRGSAKGVDTSFSAVTPGYFQAVGTRLLAGRDFNEQDNGNALAVVILNETAARAFWQDGQALGRQIVSGPSRATVVGVVADVRRLGVKGYSELIMPQVYAPSSQSPTIPLVWVVVRTVPGANRVEPELKSQALREGADFSPISIQPLDDLVSRVVGPGRKLAMQFGFISGLAAVLAVVGVGGVLLHFVKIRIHEIGIRVALGADVRDVLGWVIQKGMRLVLIGTLTGLIGAAALVHLMRSVLFEVGVFDVRSFAAAAGLMFVAGFVGCLWPAIRALSVDPATSLRHE